MNYVLLQKDIGEQIKIVDNNTNFGKKKVEHLCMEGFKAIGTIESEQPPQRLLGGFNRNLSFKLDERDTKLRDIRKVLER